MAWHNRKPVWSDRPGEAFASVAAAAQAVGCGATAINNALKKPTWRCMGRHWTTTAPEWAAEETVEAVAAAVEAERHRAASVRCNPGRNGTVINGLDVRTGRVYVGGQAVEREGVTA